MTTLLTIVTSSRRLELAHSRRRVAPALRTCRLPQQIEVLGPTGASSRGDRTREARELRRRCIALGERIAGRSGTVPHGGGDPTGGQATTDPELTRLVRDQLAAEADAIRALVAEVEELRRIAR